jgi:hypothetical protein
MKSLGMWLAIIGAGSFLLNLIGFEFSLLAWIDNWGTGTGVGIRIGLIVVGGALFFLGSKKQQDTPQE